MYVYISLFLIFLFSIFLFDYIFSIWLYFFFISIQYFFFILIFNIIFAYLYIDLTSKWIPLLIWWKKKKEKNLWYSHSQLILFVSVTDYINLLANLSDYFYLCSRRGRVYGSTYKSILFHIQVVSYRADWELSSDLPPTPSDVYSVLGPGATRCWGL